MYSEAESFYFIIPIIIKNLNIDQTTWRDYDSSFDVFLSPADYWKFNFIYVWWFW